eukprot:scaffold31797_cov78-Skeletonema_marinoi.AAC.1
MSAQQHVHNIFAETHDEQQHDEADANNDVAYRSYENRPVAEAAAAAGTTNNTGTAAEEGILPPAIAIPPVTNLYNAAQS